MLINIEDAIKEMHESVTQLRSVKSQLQKYAILKNPNADTLLIKGESLIKRINSWEENLIQKSKKPFRCCVLIACSNLFNF